MSVAEAADRSPVIVTRRDGEDLVLIRQSVVDADTAGLELAAQIFSAARSQEAVELRRLLGPFPWLALLTKRKQEQCATEVIEAPDMGKAQRKQGPRG